MRYRSEQVMRRPIIKKEQIVTERLTMHPNGHSADEEYRGKTLKCYECEMEL